MTVPQPSPPEPEPRRYPRTVGGAVYLLVIGMATTGLALTVAGAWRTGLGWMGVGLLVGAAARSVLSDYGAGMLRVRRRWSDVLTLALAGIALLVLAVIVPDQAA